VRRRLIIIFFVGLFACAYTLTGCAQQNKDIASLKKEMTELKKGQEEILKDIKSIKKFLRIPEEFKEAVVNIAEEPFKGDKDAKVTLIEFSDYQ
jgi:cell division protein FtsB